MYQTRRMLKFEIEESNKVSKYLVEDLKATYANMKLLEEALESRTKELQTAKDTAKQIDSARVRATKERDKYKQKYELLFAAMQLISKDGLCSICACKEPEKCGATCNFELKNEYYL